MTAATPIQIPETICGWRPSEYQAAILDAVLNTDDNLIIQACAGSGKTSTLRMICEVIPPCLNTIAVAFNKAIAEEFKAKLPHYVDSKTLHGVGFSACRRAHPDGITVEYKKADRLIRQYCDTQRFTDKVTWALRRELPRLMSLILATLTDARDEENLRDLAENFAMFVSEESFRACLPIINMKRGDQRNIDFDDMLDHSIVFNYPIPNYDLVLVDEAQDLNAQQMKIIDKMIGASGRVIFVGDRYQAIYGFRGACSSAMDVMKHSYQCTELPLSYCYRCGSSIVTEAQKIVGCEVIRSPEHQESGLVEEYSKDYYDEVMYSLEPGDLIVCRTNAPLVEPCLRLIRDGRKAIIRGADIADRLIGIIEMIQRDNRITDERLEDLKRYLNVWEKEKVGIAIESGRGSLASYYSDLAKTLYHLIVASISIKDLTKQIRSIFSDDNGSEIYFSTIHRSKGLESRRVIYLGPEQVPHPMAVRCGNVEQLRQEKNLDYVARTRAKKVLIYQEIPR